MIRQLRPWVAETRFGLPVRRSFRPGEIMPSSTEKRHFSRIGVSLATSQPAQTNHECQFRRRFPRRLSSTHCAGGPLDGQEPASSFIAPSVVALRSDGLFVREHERQASRKLRFLATHDRHGRGRRVRRKHLHGKHDVHRKRLRDGDCHQQRQFWHDERRRRSQQRRAGSPVRSVSVRAADVLLQDRGRGRRGRGP